MKDIENLEKKSIHALHIGRDYKDQAVQTYLTNLNRMVKLHARTKNLVILVLEEK